MDKRQAKVCFSEYDFLALYLAVKKEVGENVIINVTKLEEDLYPYAKDEEYKDLFEDIIVRDTIDKQYVYFRNAVTKAAVSGMVTIIVDADDDYKVINNLDEEEAKLIMLDNSDKVNKMKSMLLNMKVKGNTSIKYSFKPKKENE